MKTIKLKPLSINDAYRGRRFKSMDYKQYAKDLPFLLPKLEVPEGKLQLHLEFGFSNQASDTDNCIKPFLDLLQECYGFNDKRVFRIIAEKEIVPKGNEYIKFILVPLQPKKLYAVQPNHGEVP
jgi:Holliday junction resolvase RusA-like endonuclease